MAAGSGRRVRISSVTGEAAVAILGSRSDTLTINNEPIDVTDKDSAGWTTMVADVSVRNVGLAVEGVLKDGTLMAVAMGAGSGLLSDYEIEVESIGTFTGDWFLSSFETGGAHDGENTFSASLASSGAITYAAAT